MKTLAVVNFSLKVYNLLYKFFGIGLQEENSIAGEL